MSTFVVTGGAGFVGAALAAHLGRAGHDVRVLDNFSAAASHRRAAALCELPRVTLVEGDVRDAAACHRVCAGADYVLHHAGVASDDPLACTEVNVGGTVRMLEAARAVGTVQRFVCASSGAVYGDTPTGSKHEAGHVDPLSPHAASLLSAEFFCRIAFRQHGLQTVCLRYFEVYGPGQEADGEDGPVVARLLNALTRGEVPVIYGDGNESRDFVYIDDVVEANRRAVAARRGVGGRIFNIGSGQRLSQNQILEKLERLTGRHIAVRRADPRPGDIPHLRADVTAAAGLLQWTAAVGIDDGLARTLQWIGANAASGV